MFKIWRTFKKLAFLVYQKFWRSALGLVHGLACFGITTKIVFLRTLAKVPFCNNKQKTMLSAVFCLKAAKGEKMEKEFYLWAFQIDKTRIFEVEYYLLGNNTAPYFSTSAGVFNRPKTDWKQCGQCQNEVLPKYGFLRNFWKKWDAKHLQDLTEKEYADLLLDIKTLKEHYNFIEIKTPTTHHIPFWQLKELSMRKIGGKKMSKAKQMEKTQKLIEFWCFLRQNAKENETIENCNKHLSALYSEKKDILAWFLN